MSTPSNELDTYIPVYDAIPDNWEEARQFLVEQLREMTNGINARELAIYEELEQLTGGQFIRGIAQPPQFRSIFRTVVSNLSPTPLGPLPNAATLPIPHSINWTADTRIIKHHAWATDPIGLTSIPIPFVNVAAPADGIQLDIDNINVNITTTTGNYTQYTDVFVILEYIQEP